MNYNHSYRIHHELIDKKIPIKVCGIDGYVVFPRLREGLKEGLSEELKYLPEENSVGYITNSLGDFFLSKCLCQFTSEKELDKSFLAICQSYVDRLINLLEYYKFGRFGMTKRLPVYGGPYLIDCYMYQEGDVILKVFPDPEPMRIGQIEIGRQPALRRNELKILFGLCIKETLEINTSHQLYRQSIIWLKSKIFQNCIICCCAAIETIMYKQIIEKSKANGNNEKNTSMLLDKKYTGIVSMFELAKLMGIDYPTPFDYSGLASHRNNAAHRGKEPTKDVCQKYINHCKKFLEFYRIRFYE